MYGGKRLDTRVSDYPFEKFVYVNVYSNAPAMGEGDVDSVGERVRLAPGGSGPQFWTETRACLIVTCM